MHQLLQGDGPEKGRLVRLRTRTLGPPQKDPIDGLRQFMIAVIGQMNSILSKIQMVLSIGIKAWDVGSYQL